MRESTTPSGVCARTRFQAIRWNEPSDIQPRKGELI